MTSSFGLHRWEVVQYLTVHNSLQHASWVIATGSSPMASGSKLHDVGEGNHRGLRYGAAKTT